MGWHVHYRREDGRIGVYLVSDRETAMSYARGLIKERREVIRLFSHDGAERLTAEEVVACLLPGSTCGTVS